MLRLFWSILDQKMSIFDPIVEALDSLFKKYNEYVYEDLCCILLFYIEFESIFYVHCHILVNISAVCIALKNEYDV